MLSFVSMLIFVLSAENKIGIKFSTWVFGASCVNYDLIYRQKVLMHRTFVRIYTHTCLYIHKHTNKHHGNFFIWIFRLNSFESEKKLANYFYIFSSIHAAASFVDWGISFVLVWNQSDVKCLSIRWANYIP